MKISVFLLSGLTQICPVKRYGDGDSALVIFPMNPGGQLLAEWWCSCEEGDSWLLGAAASGHSHQGLSPAPAVAPSLRVGLAALGGEWLSPGSWSCMRSFKSGFGLWWCLLLSINIYFYCLLDVTSLRKLSLCSMIELFWNIKWLLLPVPQRIMMKSNLCVTGILSCEIVYDVF